MHYKHLFGPVSSRRLGASLGVDMIPSKTCNYNCVYCECGGGRTVAHKREEYIPANELIAELDHYLGTNPPIDYITFAGSGEPTLNTALGTVLQHVKQHYSRYRTALITNGALFYLPEVREEVLPFDLILPSLDAVSDKVFKRINRPSAGVAIEDIVKGLLTFAPMYRGQLWLELFIVPGINDTPDELNRFKKVLLQMQPGRIQLNSLDRPGACSWVETAPLSLLQSIAGYLKPLPVEIISRKAATSLQSGPPSENVTATILNQLLRRPASIEEIAVLCGATINAVTPALDKLIASRKLNTSIVNGQTFYTVSAEKPQPLE